MKFSDKTRDLIRKRAKDKCEVCGSLALYHQVHHRRPRGMGGTKDAVAGCAANGVWVHPHCHAMIESNRADALEKGWLVSQSQDPRKVPFKKHDGWAVLHEDGTYTMVPSPDRPSGK